MGLYLNLENGEKIDYQGDEYLPDGTNVVLAKTYKKNNQNVPKYKAIVTVVHPEKGEKEITDDLLDAAIAKGYQTKQIADAKGEGYDKAQVGKRGEVGPIEASVLGTGQGAYGVGDEVLAGARNPVGFAKAAVNYVAPDSMDFDENDPKLKAYRAETEVQRARADRGWEKEPLAYGSGMALGSVAAPGGVVAKGASKLARVGSGAALGVGNSIGGSENESIYDDGSSLALGGAIGGAIPALGAAVETAGQAYTKRLANKGGGAGAKYIDNPELLKDATEAPFTRKEIADNVRAQTLEADNAIAPLDKQLKQYDDMGKIVNENRAAEKGKLDYELGSTDARASAKLADEQTDFAKQMQSGDTKYAAEIEDAKLYKTQLEEAVTEFQSSKTEVARNALNDKFAKFQDQLEELGNQRNARFEELEAFPATEQAKQTYLQLRQTLIKDIGEMPEEQAVIALKELSKFLPEEGLDSITQGQLLKKMKRVSEKLFSKVKNVAGYGTDNFNRRVIASKVNDAFKNAGDKPLKDLTEAMREPLNSKQVLQDLAATKAVTKRNGQRVTVFSPNPMKAEKAAPESIRGMQESGYNPTITAETKKYKAQLDATLDTLELKAKVTKNANENMRKRGLAPSKELVGLNRRIEEIKEKLAALANMQKPMSKEIDAVNQSKYDITSTLDEATRANRGLAGIEVGKIRDIERLRGRDVSTLEEGVDVLADAFPGGIGRAARGGMGAITDPVRQIERRNSFVKELDEPILGRPNNQRDKPIDAIRRVFENVSLTAAVRALTFTGRTLSREAIRGLAEQHKVDPDKLEQTYREGGN